MKPKLLLTIALLALASFAVSCASPNQYVRVGQRRGEKAGAVTGVIIGNNVRGISSREAAAVGGAVGGMAGGSVRKTMLYYGAGGFYGSPRRYGRRRSYYY